MKVFVISDDELSEIVRNAVISGVKLYRDSVARDDAESLLPISANRAAKMARRRRSDVLAACRSGSLPATQTASGRGGRPEWRVRPADVLAWAAVDG